jgi:hypothetical protein
MTDLALVVRRCPRRAVNNLDPVLQGPRLHEDRSQARTGNGPRVMASLRNLAIAIPWLTGHASIAAA